MIDFTGTHDTFNAKAIPARKVLGILQRLGDLKNVIIEPHPVTGNLLIFRRCDKTTMRSLGRIEVAEERFEPETNAEDHDIPTRWQKPWR